MAMVMPIPKTKIDSEDWTQYLVQRDSILQKLRAVERQRNMLNHYSYV